MVIVFDAAQLNVPAVWVTEPPVTVRLPFSLNVPPLILRFPVASTVVAPVPVVQLPAVRLRVPVLCDAAPMVRVELPDWVMVAESLMVPDHPLMPMSPRSILPVLRMLLSVTSRIGDPVPSTPKLPVPLTVRGWA